MITLESVSKHFRSFKAIQDVSFTVREGEVFALLGPNGSGKTTTGGFVVGAACALAYRAYKGGQPR